ncbi:MAG: hypothetical protein H0X67_08375 [Acidobacteria bacterium]|nr:hypothetical protein [Acidobacteriota bacterium]
MRIFLAGFVALVLAVPCSAQTRPRIAVGGISAESNSFYPATHDFNVRSVSFRDEWLKDALRSGRGVLAGQAEAASRLGFELYPCAVSRAPGR